MSSSLARSIAARSLLSSSALTVSRVSPLAIRSLVAGPHARSFASSIGRPSGPSRSGNYLPLPINTGIVFVSQQESYIVERFGKFHAILEPGLNFLIPVIDRIAYRLSLKETAIEIDRQTAITADNVSLSIDGILFIKINDPYKAAYGIQDAQMSVAQLAMTSMRSEVGSLTLDKTFSERSTLNVQITEAINSASRVWGVECLRYEIKDINAPTRVVESMHQQVSAERSKRANILEAEGEKQSAILRSEARQAEFVNVATGEAQATTLRAEAQAKALKIVGEAIRSEGGENAVALRVAEKWVEAFSKITKDSNTIVVPADMGSAASMITQALGIYKTVQSSPGSAGSSAGDVVKQFATVEKKKD